MKFNKQTGALTAGVFLLALVVSMGVGRGVASAQTISPTVAVQATQCFAFANNIRYGAYDYSSNGAVSGLQNFLTAQGYFNSAYLGTGHFGPVTLRAVMQLQAAHGVPATGFVGPLTRALIQQITCGTNPNPVSAVSLYSINPSAGAVGTTVSVTGFGFTQDNTILMDGSVAARNVPITSSIAIACTTNPACHGGINQTLIFTVPSSLSPNCPTGSMCPMYMRLTTPGQYGITVQNANGTSNAIMFIVPSGSAQPLSITGLDAPASLALGQSGTWSVHALSNGSGNLHYSVVWGDEIYNPSIVMPQNTSMQSSATFTHAYQRSGNYTPVFTVSDDFGHAVTASNTVVVTPLY